MVNNNNINNKKRECHCIQIVEQPLYFDMDKPGQTNGIELLRVRQTWFKETLLKIYNTILCNKPGSITKITAFVLSLGSGSSFFQFVRYSGKYGSGSSYFL